MLRVFVLVALTSLDGALLYGQSTTRTCDKWYEPKTMGPKKRPAVVFGKSELVPAMSVRFILADSASMLLEKRIRIHYGWRWLDYPYPEHAWGAWVDEADVLECSLDEDGWIHAPSHKVLPRGWYDGTYTRFPWPKRPRFTEVEVVAVTKGGFARTRLQSRDLKKFVDYDLLIRVSEGWRTELTWQAKRVGR
jgi:hypothetical protein